MDPDGLALTTRYQYDANDNLICQTDARQHSTHYVYDVNNQCRYQIDARGVVTEHVYDERGNELQTTTYATRINALAEYTEALVNNALIKDSLHDQYQFRVFDGAGRINFIYDALGHATQYIYDGNDNVVKTIKYAQPVSLEALKQGNATPPSEFEAHYSYFAYDGLNQLRFQYDNGNLTELRYDSSGQLVARTAYATPIKIEEGANYSLDYFQTHLTPNSKDKTSHYAYDQAGRLSLEISPQGVVKSYRYNELNQVISCTRYASMASTSLLSSMSAEDLPQSAQDRTNFFVYDAAGRELYRISAEGQVVERRYDAVGNVVSQITHQQKVRPNTYGAEDLSLLLAQDTGARSSTYTYDATGRLLTETNAAHHTTTYTYDKTNNVASKTDANTWTYDYDEANQLIQTTSPATQVANAKGVSTLRSIITQTTYDSFGNATSEVRDATGLKQTRLYEYDALNRRTKTLYPGVAVNNASLALSNQRQEAIQTLTEELRYNAFGEVIASSDKAGNWKHFAYTSQGHLRYSLDTRGGLTEYETDAFGRVTQKTQYHSPVILGKDSDFSADTLEKAHRASEYDRHEWYEYNQDDQLIESKRDAVRTYNSKTQTSSRLAPITQRTYNAFGELVQTKTRINENDWAITTVYYDNDGHQTAVIDAEGYLTAYTLNAFGETQSMTEYAQRAQAWDTFSYRGPEVHTKDRTVTFTYDALGQMTSKTLKQVSVSRIEKNQLITTVRDLTTTYSYDALGHLVETVDAKGNSAYCYYDALGQLTAKIGPKTNVGRAATTYAYDALGNLVETHQWAKGAALADKEHYQLNLADTHDIITHAEFGAEGLLLSETDGMNHKVSYSYDANGNLARSFQTITNADKVSTFIQDKRYTYDSDNHLVLTTTFKQNGRDLHQENAQYNIFGEVTAKGVGGQYNLHVDYDLLGRVWRSNTQGYYQIYLYDLTDQVTQIVSSANGFHPEGAEQGVDLSAKMFEDFVRFNEGDWHTRLQRQDNVYDALGRLVTQTREYTLRIPDKHHKAQVTQSTQFQTLDRWGNMLTFTNALQHQTTYEYNAFNEVIRQELPEVAYMNEQGQVSRIKPVNRYEYDELGQVIALIDANGHLSTKGYDEAGHLTSETDAKKATRSKQYNLLNQLDSSVNEVLGRTTYTYDNANRLIRITTPKTQTQYTYDEAGQLIQQQNGKGDTTTFAYDTLGNQIRRQEANGRITTYEYDDAGHKTREYDAKLKGQTWTYDTNGRLIAHTDLGNHLTTYEYNTNGLVLHESATQGKNIRYYYQGDGQLIQYADLGRRGEIVDYTYDAEGQMISKESSCTGALNTGWLRETDYYQYDELGRLSKVSRRNPEDTDTRFPAEDKTLLSVDYDYDRAGNIRHTKVSAKYKAHTPTTSEDYYLYDENNRMTVNKGQLVNGTIALTSTQGTLLGYDAAGNIVDANKYENGALQKYHYKYNSDNQLELMQKNNNKVQVKEYDAAGRVVLENAFDSHGNLAQSSRFTYENGQLTTQKIYEGSSTKEASLINYHYNDFGMIHSMTIDSKGGKGAKGGSTITHVYDYEAWDTYQQKNDYVTFEADKSNPTFGKSTRVYDDNGLLEASVDTHIDDNGGSSTVFYLTSSLDGIRAKIDKNGTTGYLTVAGKTIGDLQLDHSGKQQLNIYGGFTPTGSQMEWKGTGIKLDGKSAQYKKVEELFQRQPGDIADGTLPELPQDTLGTHTLQPGETLKSIALQVYGDSSLWYLIADANGIANADAAAGKNGPLYIGQSLTIPPATAGQHHTNATHKVLDANKMIGNTSANAALPTPRPPKPKHHSILSKVIVFIIATVATVMTAGALGALAGAMGGAFLSTTVGSIIATTAISFTAGFVGNMAGQAASMAMGMQNKIDVTSSLISGVAMAATAGLGKYLGGIQKFTELKNTIDHLAINKTFGISSAMEMMEQNVISQGANVTFRRHQHFDWLDLGVTTATAGFLGGSLGEKIDENLNKIDHNTGILSKGFKTLAGEGIQSTATGTHFDATQVIADKLGSIVGNILGHNIMDATLTPEKSFMELMDIDDLLFGNDPIDDALDAMDGAYNYLLASQFNSSESISNTPKGENLFLYGSELSGFVGHTIYNDSTRPIEGQGVFPIKEPEIITPPLRAEGDDITYQESPYSFEEALNIQMKLRGSSASKVDVGGHWKNASRAQVSKYMDIDNIFSDPIKKLQFMDLHYQKGISVESLDALLDGKGVLNGTGSIFLEAAENNDINPIYLVAHALHETNKGKDKLSKNNNFFGLGATDGNAVENGIKFAKKHGWTTIKKGIMGGAQIISKTWVNRIGKSQNTLYAMRWNPIDPGKGQYATDINWANRQTTFMNGTVNNMRQIDCSYRPKFIIPKYR
jgi:YD repeat-containing protein